MSEWGDADSGIRFSPPPGWPEPASRHWLPAESWSPSADWPSSPVGWVFYRGNYGEPVAVPSGRWHPSDPVPPAPGPSSLLVGEQQTEAILQATLAPSASGVPTARVTVAQGSKHEPPTKLSGRRLAGVVLLVVGCLTLAGSAAWQSSLKEQEALDRASHSAVLTSCELDALADKLGYTRAKSAFDSGSCEDPEEPQLEAGQQQAGIVMGLGGAAAALGLLMAVIPATKPT